MAVKGVRVELVEKSLFEGVFAKILLHHHRSASLFEQREQ
jgi:hypothetical protein